MRPTIATLAAAGSLAALCLLPSAHAAVPGVTDYTVPADRSADPVVLTGKDLMAGGSTWAVPENLTLAVPSKDVTCFAQSQGASCPDQFNHYVAPDADTSGTQSQLPIDGTPTDLIRGYRWNPHSGKFQEIRFQVDEMFTRYLNNDASGFGIYSGTDQHTTYAFDHEPFRRTANDPSNPCFSALPAGAPDTTPDPVKGLDTNDELAFMAADAGPQAPSGATLPNGVLGAKVVTITDPTNPGAQPSYVYIGRLDANFAADPDNASKFADPSTWYVHYADDPDSRVLAYSKSSNGTYGPAVVGTYCLPDGTMATGPRRELDTATITTDRYQFHYGGEPGLDTGKSGRWLMTSVQIKQPDGSWGPDLVDRWKARAFAQDSASHTPCCGYEEEDTNWGGSSNLLGERVGPVRAIRETWGADSGTNVIRRETFYRDMMVQKSYLRVHVIPPLDGIYAQWDFNAGRVQTFYNSQHPGGVTIDGKNDELYGNFDDPCNARWDGDNGPSMIDAFYRSTYKGAGLCGVPGLSSEEHASIDPGDATFADANASLGWSEVDGPFGTIVDRIHAQPTDLTPGGVAQSLAAVPYYRDDSCFDDGTGSDPGKELYPRHPDQEVQPGRRCWHAGADPQYPGGDPTYYQGDIGTHGLHLLFQAESDNARTTEPIDQIVTDWDMKFLPPRVGDGGGTVPNGNVGEAEGRALEKPLVAVAADAPQAPDPGNAKGKGKAKG